MNDPHVVALIYNVHPSLADTYSEAQALHYDHEAFRITSDAGQIRFDMKRHYSTELEAREVVDLFIRHWQFHSDLADPCYSLRLNFCESEVVDRNPPSNGVFIHATSRARWKGTAQLHVRYPHYPTPPRIEFDITPNVASMYHRYCAYTRQQEPLVGMAYFCLTMLISSAAPQNRIAAARRYRISRGVLCRIGDLTTNKGGARARKAAGVANTLTRAERRFLIAATRAMILRAAQVEHDPSAPHPLITLRNIIF